MFVDTIAINDLMRQKGVKFLDKKKFVHADFKIIFPSRHHMLKIGIWECCLILVVQANNSSRIFSCYRCTAEVLHYHWTHDLTKCGSIWHLMSNNWCLIWTFDSSSMDASSCAQCFYYQCLFNKSSNDRSATCIVWGFETQIWVENC